MRKFLIYLLVLTLLPCVAFAQTDTESLSWQTVPIITPVSKDVLYWDFPYSDDWFTHDATIYNHRLAQSSLGLALSAFRQKHVDLSQRDFAVRDYLTGAGFTDLVSEEYDVIPSIDTIATMIGTKKIGECTLVVVAVSGGDYEKEWQSNFSIGSQQYSNANVYHDGFAKAADMVLGRITKYMDERGLKDNVKIWITGYSRAAAVSNITAFALIQFGVVPENAIYAYTFATPRCIKEADIVKCSSIFNIVGSFDPVAGVPFAEWGFGRFGTTMYLPAEEICSNYSEYRQPVAAIYDELTGLEYWNSPMVNWICAKLMQALDEVMTNAGSYQSALQQFIIDVINLEGGFISKAFQGYRLLNSNSELKEYLSAITFNTDTLFSTIAHTLFRQWLGLDANQFAHGVGAVAELAHEHCPDVYIAWMFSRDDASPLYTDEYAYHQISLENTCDLVVKDANGNPVTDYICFKLGDANLLTLPGDQRWTIEATARNSTTVHPFILERETQHMYARVLLYTEDVVLSAGESVLLTIPSGVGADMRQFTIQQADKTQLPIDTSVYDMNSDYAALDTSYSGSWARGFLPRTFIIILCIIVLLLGLLVWLIVHIVRKHRKRRHALIEAASDQPVLNEAEKHDGTEKLNE